MPCTIASVLPFPVKEPNKPGLCPGEYPLGPSDGKRPVLLIVKDAVRPQYNEDFKIIDMPVPAKTVANSVVDDYVTSQQLTSEEACPGLFFVDGEYSQADFEKVFADKINEALNKQDRWFKTLVKDADDWWQQHHQHRFISDLARSAARFLNYKREWLDDSSDKTIKCPACMTYVSREAAICFACHAILNEEKYKALKFAGPQQVAPQVK